MNEVMAYKLIELYYINKKVFNSYGICLEDLCDKYNEILKILKGDNKEEKWIIL